MAALLSNIDDKIGLFTAIPLYCLWAEVSEWHFQFVNKLQCANYWILKPQRPDNQVNWSLMPLIKC